MTLEIPLFSSKSWLIRCLTDDISVSHVSPSGSGFLHSEVSSELSPHQSDSDDLKAQLQALIEEGITGADLKLRINELAKAGGYQPRELWGIYNAQLTESERDRVLSRVSQETSIFNC